MLTKKDKCLVDISSEGCEVEASIPLGLRVGEGSAGWKGNTLLTDDKRRGAIAELVEQGEISLYLNPNCEGAVDLPLCFVDYSMIETKGGGRRISVDPGAWSDACRLVGMHAVLSGVGKGLEADSLEEQFAAWERKGMTLPKP